MRPEAYTLARAMCGEAVAEPELTEALHRAQAANITNTQLIRAILMMNAGLIERYHGETSNARVVRLTMESQFTSAEFGNGTGPCRTRFRS